MTTRRDFLTRSILGAAAVALAEPVEAKASIQDGVPYQGESWDEIKNQSTAWTRHTVMPQKVWYKKGTFYQLTTNEQGKWRIAAKSSNGSTWAPTT